MSIEVFIGLVIASLPGMLMAGGALADLSRVKRDVADCVRRETYAVEQKAHIDKLTRIESIVERLYDRITGYSRTPRPDDREDTGPHPRSR